MADLEQRNLIGRHMFYFMTAHQMWWMPISFAVNVTVIYVLLFDLFPFLYIIFPTIIHFGIVFGISYIVGADSYGWWWVHKSGIWKGGVDVSVRQNPFFAEMMSNQKTILKNQEGLLERVECLETTNSSPIVIETEFLESDN